MEFDKQFLSVYVSEDGQHKVITPKGEDITHLVRTIVVDEVDSPAICEAHFCVNIVPSREYAIKKYEE